MPAASTPILGENGAGKSTLIKIMAGVVAPDEGRMSIDGQRGVPSRRRPPANAAGIACIFQELSLIPHLSVADNIVISNPPKRFGLIDARAQRRIAEEALARAGASDIHPLALVKDLPLSRRQVVEIAKALVRKPRILILDEATSALTAADVSREGLRGAEAAARRGLGAALHLAPHARDRRTRRRLHGVPQRPQRGDYAAGTKTDNEVVETDDRPRIQPRFPAKNAGARERQARKPVLRTAAVCSWNDRLNDISLSVRGGRGGRTRRP